MKRVPLSKIELDAKGWLRLYPAGECYDYIYRAAAGVSWDEEGRFLHAHEPEEWSYSDYFRQIVSVVTSEYGDRLEITPDTEWLGVSDALRKEILREERGF